MVEHKKVTGQFSNTPWLHPLPQPEVTTSLFLMVCQAIKRRMAEIICIVIRGVKKQNLYYGLTIINIFLKNR